MSIWTGPLSFLYQAVTDIRNDLFNRQTLSIHRVDVPVLSIGNLTVGGTGKTPFVDYTIKYFLRRNKRVAVVSRAYKARAKEPIKVDVEVPQASLHFGDEPVWLAKENPQATVFVGQSKWQIATYAFAHEKMDLMVVDDGFQHRKLHRDLNVLILDATETIENYRTLPLGKAREKFENIERADMVVLSKCNWADAETLRAIRAKIPAGKEIVEIGSNIYRFRNFHTGQFKEVSEFREKSVLLFCSIARPDFFERTCADLVRETESLPFPDHHQFQPDDVESILRKKEKYNLQTICCTEKDAVKLADVWPADQELWVSELEIQILKNKERLYEIYDRFCP